MGLWGSPELGRREEGRVECRINIRMQVVGLGNGHSTGFVFGRDLVDLEASATASLRAHDLLFHFFHGERERKEEKRSRVGEFKGHKVCYVYVYARKRRLLFGSLGTDRQHIVNYGQLFCQSPVDDESNL